MGAGRIPAHRNVHPRAGGGLLAAALILVSCVSPPPPLRISEEPVSDGLHQVEVRSPGALLVSPRFRTQLDRAMAAGGYALGACTVAFSGEHDVRAIRPLQNALSANFCNELAGQLETQTGIEIREARPRMILFEAYLLNLDPDAVSGTAREPRFEQAIDGRLYIKATQDGRPVVRYSEIIHLGRGHADAVLQRSLADGVANMNRIYSRLGESGLDVAAQPD